MPNVLLTPHIGGSTEEAQAAIGREVALALVKYVSTGSTAGAVNFPQASCQALTLCCEHLLRESNCSSCSCNEWYLWG